MMNMRSGRGAIGAFRMRQRQVPALLRLYRFYKTEAEQTEQPNRTEQQVSSKLIFSECGNRNHSDRTQFTHVHRPRAVIGLLAQYIPSLRHRYRDRECQSNGKYKKAN